MAIPIQPIPETYDEAVERIVTNLSHEDKLLFLDDLSFAMMHHGLGQSLRNEWGLWNGSKLKTYFMENFGLGHADDMSGLILDRVRAEVGGKSFDVVAKVNYYQNYWRNNYGIDPLTQEPIRGHPKAGQ